MQMYECNNGGIINVLSNVKMKPGEEITTSALTSTECNHKRGALLDVL